MEYQSYEDYMREVLKNQNLHSSNNVNNMGGNATNNDMYYDTYFPRMEFEYYETPDPFRRVETTNFEELEQFYPDIYRILHPMVAKVCNQNMNNRITKEMLDEMVMEIYRHVEIEEKQTTNISIKPQMRAGDVRNLNIKEPETRGETRRDNFLMQDLIRILLLRELLRPAPRPPVHPPHFPGRPGPSRPPMRPRGYDGLC